MSIFYIARAKARARGEQRRREHCRKKFFMVLALSLFSVVCGPFALFETEPYEPVLARHLCDHVLDAPVEVAALGVVGFEHKVDSALSDQPLAHLRFAAGIDPYRTAAAHFDQFHARNVGHSVAEVDHIAERHRALVFGHILIDRAVVPQFQSLLVDAVEELSFARKVDRDRRPYRRAVLVIVEFACIYALELVRDRSPLDRKSVV